MSSLASQRRPRMDTVAVVGMMCGRTVGRFHQGRVCAESPGRTIRQEGPKVRCGHCGGNVHLDLDPTADLGVGHQSATETGLRGTGGHEHGKVSVEVTERVRMSAPQRRDVREAEARRSAIVTAS